MQKYKKKLTKKIFSSNTPRFGHKSPQHLRRLNGHLRFSTIHPPTTALSSPTMVGHGSEMGGRWVGVDRELVLSIS